MIVVVAAVPQILDELPDRHVKHVMIVIGCAIPVVIRDLIHLQGNGHEIF